jgi:hypothetical protein
MRHRYSIRPIGLVLIAVFFATGVAGCSLITTPSPTQSQLVGKWHHGTSATLSISTSGTITFTDVPSGALIGDQTYSYGTPVTVVGTWDADSKKPLPTYQTNGGIYDRSLHVEPVQSDLESWPTDGTNLDITRNGSHFELRFPLGDPDSDAWYTFTR